MDAWHLPSVLFPPPLLVMMFALPQLIEIGVAFFTPLLSSGNLPPFFHYILSQSATLWMGTLFPDLHLFIVPVVVAVFQCIFSWLIQRVRSQVYVTACFEQGDAAYEWLNNLLVRRFSNVVATERGRHSYKLLSAHNFDQMEEEVGLATRTFVVKAKTSKRMWGIESCEASADFIPQYSAAPQTFSFEGISVDVRQESKQATGGNDEHGGPMLLPGQQHVSLVLTLRTHDSDVLVKLVQEAQRRYADMKRTRVIVHTLSMDPTFGLVTNNWPNTKMKPRRPSSTVNLPEGVMERLLKDLQDFCQSEKLYQKLGIPHRMGIFLEGPPGTGKTSTIYSIAGELGLEIFSLSLSNRYLDDCRLEAIVSAVPKGSILVIEDIDCAFASRARSVHGHGFSIGFTGPEEPQSRVTLSGLLNILDGVGSDEGRILFATTNHADRLDPAVLRPGRFDTRICYKLATRKQAFCIFRRLFSDERFRDPEGLPSAADQQPTSCPSDLSHAELASLASDFARYIPGGVFSTAELQGYLRNYLSDPIKAVKHAKGWVKKQRVDKVSHERRRNAGESQSTAAPQALMTMSPLAQRDLHAIGLPTPSMDPAASLPDIDKIDSSAGALPDVFLNPDDNVKA